MCVGSRPRWILFSIVLLLGMLLPMAATPVSTQAQPGERCFAETGLCISGRLLQYWEQNGGLPVFGLPITPQREETIGDWIGQMQWFERNRIELHPENAPPYDVLLGRLGAEFVAESGGPPPRQEPREGCQYFDQTGFNVCGNFLASWSASGLDLGDPGVSTAESLALFGLPLTGEFEATLEDGTTHVVQWFERARFELHPENDPPYNVLLTRLGVAKAGEPQAQPGTPAAEDPAAVETAIRAYLGPEIGNNPPTSYSVERICIDQGFAIARINPEQERYDAFGVLLELQAGQWTVIVDGRSGVILDFLSAERRAELGIPADFACLQPPPPQ